MPFTLAQDLIQDLRHGIRSLKRSKGLALGVVISMGLGLGTTAAQFSLVDFFVFRPLPVPETNRVVRITNSTPVRAIGSFSYPEYPRKRHALGCRRSCRSCHCILVRWSLLLDSSWIGLSTETYAALFVETEGPPETLVFAVRMELRNMAPTMPIFDVRTMQDHVRENGLLDPRRGA